MSDDNSPLALLANGGDKDAAEDALDAAEARFAEYLLWSDEGRDQRRADSRKAFDAAQKHARALSAALNEIESLMFVNDDLSEMFRGFRAYPEFREDLDYLARERETGEPSDDIEYPNLFKRGRSTDHHKGNAWAAAEGAWMAVHGRAPSTTKNSAFQRFGEAFVSYLNDAYGLDMQPGGSYQIKKPT